MIEGELFEQIKELIGARQYRVRLHAVRHMIEEGFGEQDILVVLGSSKSRILEDYPDESRCLIFGRFMLNEKTRSPLHVVCDYSQAGVVDVVTAYVPQRPWWATPTKRGKMR
ncbi:MAG TPA: DUF4258 domain-containing protein [Pyrinomonadaceae bacterium]|nr:DUF4258 domain-containing protein [Pyrinomonadaceae bacterium]